MRTDKINPYAGILAGNTHVRRPEARSDSPRTKTGVFHNRLQQSRRDRVHSRWLFAGSISLIGFGLDSFIEVTSAASLIWRFGRDRDEARRAAAERMSLRIVGLCFIGLAAYVAYDSGLALIRGEAPERSIPGIVIALASLAAMPLLAKAKRKVASAIASSAMHADARQTDFCTYLSVILLVGLLLNALFGLWWADPAAALCMAPVIAKEGADALRGRSTCGCSSECR
jgi:divalent metal cation (Fe/Co/Zn/Cd) transporter